MATLLALGIPGGGATAVMLAAFAMHNITGGPQFIREKTDIVYAIIVANFGQAFLLIMLGLMFIGVTIFMPKGIVGTVSAFDLKKLKQPAGKPVEEGA